VSEPLEQSATSPLTAVSNALVALHKEQFGRGPTRARTHFAGPDAMLCVLEDALLPAERRMAETGEAQRVRESRMAFQVATAPEFIDAIERLVHRKVVAFGSATDVENNVVFETYVFQPLGVDGDGRRPHAPAAS
jgi:uncharacterized protein YbcI